MRFFDRVPRAAYAALALTAAAAGLAGAAALLAPTGAPDTRPAGQEIVLDTAVTSTDVPSPSSETITTSTAGEPVTTTATEPAPVIVEPTGNQQPVGAATEPEPTTVEPAPVTTTTTTQAVTTSRVPTEPWCYKEGHGWFSGSGEGCTPESQYFVEYR